MTNAEKYKEVFGFPPDKASCPTECCVFCPGHVEECLCTCKWWDEEYKEEYKEERPQGEWIYTDKEDKKKGYGGYCSVCKCDMPIGIHDWKQIYYESKFCPNCGAYMRGKNNGKEETT